MPIFAVAMTRNKLYIIFLLTLLPALSVFGLRKENTLSLSTADGLPSNDMSMAVQAPDGFLWIGTSNGLSRFDGYSFVNFYGNGNYQTNHIGTIRPDWDNGLLWVTSGRGQTGCFDTAKQQFIDFTGCGKAGDTYWGLTIGKNVYWQYSSDYGARRIVRKGATLVSTQYNTENGRLRSNFVVDIKNDTDGNSWLLTKKGVAMVDAMGRKRIELRREDIVCINTVGKVCLMLSRRDGFLEMNSRGKFLAKRKTDAKMPSKVTGNTVFNGQWLIFSEKGAVAYDTKRHAAITLPANAYIPNGTIVGQNNAAVFIGNNYGILYRYAKDGKVKKFELIPPHIIKYTHKDHFNIATTTNGEEFICTYGNGLFAYNPTTESMSHYAAGEYLVNVSVDNSDRIWTLKDHKGLSCINTAKPNGKYRLLAPSSAVPDDNSVRAFALSDTGELMASDMRGNVYYLESGTKRSYDSKVYAILTDSKRRTWIGTRGSGLFVAGSGAVDKFPCRDIYDIYEDKNGRLWFATSKGLVVKRADGSFVHSLKGKFLHDIEGDDKGNVWIASEDGLYVVTARRALHFSKRRQSFPSNDVICLQRGHGYMAVGTVGSGIVFCTLDGERLSYNAITTDNGLTSNVVNAIETDRQGRTWAATEEGLSCIVGKGQTVRKFYFADDIDGNSYNENASMALPDGELVFGTRNGILTITPEEIDTKTDTKNIAITAISVNGQPCSEAKALAYNQNTITVDFSDFSFTDAQSSVYTYMLEGADSEWSRPTSTNTVTFANLRPGNYLFHVKTVGGREEATLAIQIRQPWWNSLWAWMTYFVVAIAAISIYIVVSRRIRRAETELRIEKKTTEIKVNFFTNIANELRTPLTLVRGAAENLKDGGSRTTLQALRNGTHRLMRTARQLSLFRELNLGKVKLQVENGDIVRFLRDICDEYRAIATERGLSLTFTPSEQTFTTPFDREKTELVVCGVMSNAINTTAKGGSIAVKTRQEADTLHIIVENDGCTETMPDSDSYTVGIGLFIAKRMAEIHHGKLSYISTNERHCAYRFSIPSSSSFYTSDEWSATITVESHVPVPVESEPQGMPYNDCRILIVEGDTDMATMMRNHLGKYFTVECTDKCDGSEDCDVMIMDATTSHDAYDTVKTAKTTSDIRVVMLVNDGSTQERLKAINCGADETLEKPVSLQVLLAVVAKLSKRQTNNQSDNKPIIVSETDIRFKKELSVRLAQHIAEPDLTVARLAEMMHYSPTQLHKKVKELEGLTPMELIRRERMEYAARLLSETHMTVNEISDKMGYTSTTRFFKHFKQLFGCTPLQYRKSNV